MADTKVRITFAMNLVYNTMVFFVPAIRIVLPKPVFMAILKAVETSFDYKVKVDIKPFDWDELDDIVLQLIEVAKTRGEEEQYKLIWEIFEFVTTIEDSMNQEQFIAAVRGIPLPAADVNEEDGVPEAAV
jgi:hypothetical protein